MNERRKAADELAMQHSMMRLAANGQPLKLQANIRGKFIDSFLAKLLKSRRTNDYHLTGRF